jgi:hypothetical protein
MKTIAAEHAISGYSRAPAPLRTLTRFSASAAAKNSGWREERAAV